MRNVYHANHEQADYHRLAEELFNFRQDPAIMIPSFWALIGNKLENLKAIFKFFYEMRSLQEQDETNEIRVDEVREILRARLFARFHGKTIAFPCEFSEDVKLLSQKQIALFKQLETKNLLAPAFELFVSGSLSIKKEKDSEANLVDPADTEIRDPYPEPNSGAFFFWAEFAFLAAYFGFDSETWKHYLPILLRAERIFAICYGQAENGGSLRKTEFDHYLSLRPEEFNPIDLGDSQKIRMKPLTRFDDLEIEATDCARFAFPGEFDKHETPGG